MKFVFSILIMAFCVAPSFGNDLEVHIENKSEKPFDGAVVSVIPKFEFSQTMTKRIYKMQQKDKIFTPHILVIPTGSQVTFPNLDNITHHVYSFSASKRFDLKLFKLESPEPVTFDKSGVVVVGCNIHDWMLGYIKVVDTPFNKMTDDAGKVAFTNLPDGDYDVQIWHPRFRDKHKRLSKTISLMGNKKYSVSFKLKKSLKALPDLSEDEDY